MGSDSESELEWYLPRLLGCTDSYRMISNIINYYPSSHLISAIGEIRQEFEEEKKLTAEVA